MRKPFIAGNWKMNNTIAEAEALIQALLPRVGAVDDVDVVVCPPFLSLQAVVDSVRGSAVGVYAQNMHEADDGAYTGEVSRADAGGDRRARRDPRPLRAPPATSARPTGRCSRRCPSALAAGLVPILCVGETEEERERGDTERKLRHQVQEGLEKVPMDRLPEVVVAYEPIWAIGTGLTATPEQAQEAIAFVRALVQGIDKERRRPGAGARTAAR